MSREDLTSGKFPEVRSLVATSMELSCCSADFYEYCFLNAVGREMGQECLYEECGLGGP